MHEAGVDTSDPAAVEKAVSAGSPVRGATSELYAEAIKRAFDVTCAVLAVLAFLPLILTVAIVILAFDGAPLTIRHHRVGRGGALFPCRKFRTMVRNGDEVLRRHLLDNEGARNEWDETRKLREDPRVTPLGRILRSSSLDEIPQLLNIIAGEMSFVGPRPIVEAEVTRYGAAIRYYLKVRPGLTGLWQISGRSETSYSNRVKLDVEYVSNWSFARDLQILVKTIPAVFAARGSY